MADNAMGKYIAMRRKELHLTQEKMAERLSGFGLDVAESTLAGWERGHQKVPIDKIPKLAEALGERSANRLYELSGILDEIKGGDIAALLADQSDDTIETATDLVKTLLKKKS